MNKCKHCLQILYRYGDSVCIVASALGVNASNFLSLQQRVMFTKCIRVVFNLTPSESPEGDSDADVFKMC